MTKMDGKHIWKRVQKSWDGFFLALLCVGIIFGVSLTNQADMFYNSLLMPIAGACGYILFRKHAFYKVPILLLVFYLIVSGVRAVSGGDAFDIYSAVVWVGIYSIFSVIGAGIAGLFYYARHAKKSYRILSGTTGMILIAGLCVFANALVGNPISKAIAVKEAKDYLTKQYAGFELKKVSYNFKEGNYLAYVERPNSKDLKFTVSLDMFGNMKYDDYEFRIEDGANTQDRLGKEYRELTDALLLNWQFPYHGEIVFGDLDLEKLDLEYVPDKIYDIRELGKEAGTIVLYIEDAVVTKERADEIIKDVKKRFDEAGIPFRYLDFTLESPEGKEGKESISMGRLSYDEIP